MNHYSHKVTAVFGLVVLVATALVANTAKASETDPCLAAQAQVIESYTELNTRYNELLGIHTNHLRTERKVNDLAMIEHLIASEATRADLILALDAKRVTCS